MGGILCKTKSGDYSLGRITGQRNRMATGFVSMDGQGHSAETDSSGFYTIAAIWAPPFACTANMEQQTVRDHNSPNLLQLLTRV